MLFYLGYQQFINSLSTVVVDEIVVIKTLIIN